MVFFPKVLVSCLEITNIWQKSWDFWFGLYRYKEGNYQEFKISNKTVCDKKEIRKGRKNVRVDAAAERKIYGSVTLISAQHSSTPFTLRGARWILLKEEEKWKRVSSSPFSSAAGVRGRRRMMRTWSGSWESGRRRSCASRPAHAHCRDSSSRRRVF
jgi:hypothetical protein